MKAKKILVTGSAGFIGFHTAKSLLERDCEVVGIDNVNDYYDVRLKNLRTSVLLNNKNAKSYSFYKMDLCDKAGLTDLFSKYRFDVVINLAAQAGVRYSLEQPDVYLRSNLEGFLNILELCRHNKPSHLIYASSSSVYGINGALPFSENKGVDHPISLYAATKRSNELMAHCYSHLFGLPTTGLRFFTVYGPWGRPDMAMYLFADAILNEKPLRLFNNGDMERDFTFVDDIVESIVRLCETPAQSNAKWKAEVPEPCTSSAPFRVYNIGNHSPVLVSDVVRCMEEYFGKSAKIENAPIQPGDVRATCADVERLFSAVGFQPKTPMKDGLRKFLDWYTWYIREISK